MSADEQLRGPQRKTTVWLPLSRFGIPGVGPEGSKLARTGQTSITSFSLCETMVSTPFVPS